MNSPPAALARRHAGCADRENDVPVPADPIPRSGGWTAVSSTVQTARVARASGGREFVRGFASNCFRVCGSRLARNSRMRSWPSAMIWPMRSRCSGVSCNWRARIWMNSRLSSGEPGEVAFADRESLGGVGLSAGPVWRGGEIRHGLGHPLPRFWPAFGKAHERSAGDDSGDEDDQRGADDFPSIHQLSSN